MATRLCLGQFPACRLDCKAGLQSRLTTPDDKTCPASLALVYTVRVIRDNLHEDFARKQEGRGSSNRNFGLVFAAFFVVVALLPLRHHHPAKLWACPVAALFLLVALLKPALLSPLNKYWTNLGLLMGRIVSPVVTAILFYVVVTPTALLFRLMGKDPLRLALEPQTQSYWLVRRPPGPAPGTMANQF